ncbi:hypothetical protein EPUL_005918, partial [Erysiphe pulchra]
MVCTNFVCNIGSTVSSFQDGEELEMAKSIQTYLRTAISEFTASDATPTLPKQQLKSNKAKVSETFKTNLPRIPLMTSVPPKILISHFENKANTSKNFLSLNPSEKYNSWSIVARNVSPNGIQKTPNYINIASIKNKDTSGNLQDNRLFICLPAYHEWCNLSPAGIRKIVVKRLSFSPAQIDTIKPVHSGFAISPRNNSTRQELLKNSLRLSSSGAKLEAAPSGNLS